MWKEVKNFLKLAKIKTEAKPLVLETTPNR